MASDFKIKAFVYLCACLYFYVIYKFGKYVLGTKMYKDKMNKIK